MAIRRSQSKVRTFKLCGRKLSSRYSSCLTSTFAWETFCHKKRKEGKVVQLTDCAKEILRQHSINF